MGSREFAPKISRKNGFTGNGDVLEVEDGNSVLVYGWSINNASGTTDIIVNIETAESVPQVITRLNLRVRTNIASDIPFVADKGIRINLVDAQGAASTVSATVFHGNIV